MIFCRLVLLLSEVAVKFCGSPQRNFWHVEVGLTVAHRFQA